jgi:hypothetical protein
MTLQAISAVSAFSPPAAYVSMTDEEEAKRYNDLTSGETDDGYDQLDRDAFGGVFG